MQHPQGALKAHWGFTILLGVWDSQSFWGFEIHNPFGGLGFTILLGSDLQPCGRFVVGDELGVFHRTKATPPGALGDFGRGSGDTLN